MNLKSLDVKQLDELILSKMSKELALCLRERCQRILDNDTDNFILVDTPRELGRLQGSSLRVKWLLKMIEPLM
jgi:hypothetical protein